MKNILLVIETRGPGGAETVLLHLAQHLDRQKYRIRVVLLKPGWLEAQLKEHGIVVEDTKDGQTWRWA